MQIFDRGLVRRRRDRAADGFGDYDFLVREVAGRLAERLDDVKRSFPLALDLGSRGGRIGPAVKRHGGIERLVRLELSPAAARSALAEGPPGPVLVADEEFLPIAPASLDLVLSALSLHWVNDLPGALLQIARALKPDGLFLGAMLGGETLFELRVALTEAEIELEGGASPRLSPMAELRDLGGLLQRAGFALPVADLDEIEVTYQSLFHLLRDLRGMAETGAALARPRIPPPRALFFRAAEIYAERFGRPDGRIPATFQVLFLTGWAPHPEQPKPLRPGSAAARLAEALGTVEQPAGDKAPGGEPR